MKNYRIAMIKHGTIECADEGRYIGSTDIPLSKECIEKLKDLTSLYDYPKVEKVYSSPLKRAVQTAEILYPNTLIETVDGLKEYDFGIFENRSIDELSNDPLYKSWLAENMKEPPQGGESKEQFANRIVFGFNNILMDMMKNQIFSAALIGHAGVMSAIASQFALPKRSPIQWKWQSGKGYLFLTSTQQWTRDNMLELVAEIPYNENDSYSCGYYWLDYNQNESSSDR